MPFVIFEGYVADMMDRSTYPHISGGGYGHHHYKVTKMHPPEVGNICIIYPLKFASMYMVNWQD